MKIKPCPFCNNGNVELMDTHIEIITIVCASCGAIVSFVNAEKENQLIEAWNNRPK